MQYAILAACRRPGFVLCAGWYRRTFRAKTPAGFPESIGSTASGWCPSDHLSAFSFVLRNRRFKVGLSFCQAAEL